MRLRLDAALLREWPAEARMEASDLDLEELHPEDFGLDSVRKAVRLFLSTYPKKMK